MTNGIYPATLLPDLPSHPGDRPSEPVPASQQLSSLEGCHVCLPSLFEDVLQESCWLCRPFARVQQDLALDPSVKQLEPKQDATYKKRFQSMQSLVEAKAHSPVFLSALCTATSLGFQVLLEKHVVIISRLSRIKLQYLPCVEQFVRLSKVLQFVPFNVQDEGSREKTEILVPVPGRTVWWD